MVKLNDLPEKEREVADCLIENPTWGNQQIADHLGKANKTVEHQLRRTYGRFGITGDNCQKRISFIMKVLKGEIQWR